MPKKVVLGQELTENRYSLGVGKWFYTPTLISLAIAPTQNTRPALGVYNDVLYIWDVTQQKWVKYSSGDNNITGTLSITGTGVASTFGITHGLGFDPTTTGFEVTAVNNIAKGIHSVSANATQFLITYDVCKVGTMTFFYTVKKP